MYIHTCTYIYIYIYIHTHTHIYIHIYICILLHTCICIYVHTRTSHRTKEEEANASLASLQQRLRAAEAVRDEVQAQRERLEAVVGQRGREEDALVEVKEALEDQVLQV